MSEGLAHGESAPATDEPVYGDGRLSYEVPAASADHLDGRTGVALALAIFVPVMAAYGAAVYAAYRVADALS